MDTVTETGGFGVPLPFARSRRSPGGPRWCRHPAQRDAAGADGTALLDALGRVLSRYTGGSAPVVVAVVAGDAPPSWVRLTAGDRANDRADAAAPLVRVAVVWGRSTGDRPPAPSSCGLVVELAGAVVQAWHDQRVLGPAGVDRVLDDVAAALGAGAGCRDSEAVGATEPFSEEPTVLAAFERHARATPDAIAALSGEASATYAELDGWATTLAARLQALGARPETYVVLLLPPSIELMAGALAAFKTGAAFVPVDPEYPDRRVRELIGSVPDPITVTTPAHASAIGAQGRRLLVGSPSGDHRAPRPVTIAPDSAACALFTSASTGSSKGVVITHRGLRNLAHCAIQRLGLGPDDRFLQLASPSFSAFLEEAFPSLVAGGSLVLAGYRAGMPSAPRLLENLAGYQATAFGITTAHWQHLVDHLTATGATLPPKVRLALMGSERALPETVARWSALGVPMVHVYGPTEATATATYFHLGEERADPDFDLPIGRVIPNTRLYLCDDDLRLVPYGVPGEVYLGGISLARGYLNAVRATADRFVPDPFGPPGGRLYRTGDLARFLPDGNLEFLSRDASLIKVHGCRVNPAEVETALEAHPAVVNAAVVSTKDVHGADRLTGYVVPAPDAVVDIREVRRFLAARLPSFMVPAVLVAVPTFPLNANGKTDRKALAAASAGAGGGEHVPAATPTQHAVAEIWASVLGVPAVGVTDDFFELGGDSLQILRVGTELRHRLGADVGLAEIFARPTVAGLAELVDARVGDGRATETIDRADLRSRRWLLSRTIAERTGIAGAAPISLSQQGLWFVTRLQPRSGLYTTAWRCVLTGELDRDSLAAAAAAVFARHEPLRTRFTVSAGQPLQVVMPAPAEALTVVEPSGADVAARRESARALGASLAAEGFDVETGPLCRIVLLPVDDDEHELLVIVHHLVCDHWSERILLRDLAATYTAHLAGGVAELPPLPLSYQDYAVWQRATMQRDTGERLRAYWRDRLTGLTATPLPYDDPRRADHDFAGDSVTVAVPADLYAALRDLGAERSATPFMVLLAAYFVLLHRHTEATDLCIGTPLANRSRPEVENLVGYFVNLVGLRLDLSGDPAFRVLVDRTRHACVDGYEHQELPFHLAVREVHGHERSPGVTPLFQAAITMDDDPATGLTAPGLRFGPAEDVRTGRVGLDLVFLLVNRATGVELTAEYSSRLFRRETISGLVADYLAVLRRVTEEPDVRLSELAGAGQLTLVDALRRMWAQAFRVDSVDADQDFFEMGGSSLLAAQLVAGLSELLEVDVTLRMFFESATIAELAGRISGDHGIERVPAARLAELGDVGSIGELIDGIGGLSDDEVAAALSGSAASPELR